MRPSPSKNPTPGPTPGPNPRPPRSRLPPLDDPFYILLNHLCHDLRLRLGIDGVCAWAQLAHTPKRFACLSINHPLDAKTHLKVTQNFTQNHPLTGCTPDSPDTPPPAVTTDRPRLATLHGQPTADAWLQGLTRLLPGFTPIRAWLIQPQTSPRTTRLPHPPIDLAFLSSSPQASPLTQAIEQLIPDIDLVVQTTLHDPAYETASPPNESTGFAVLSPEIRLRRLSITEKLIADWLRTPQTERQIALALKRSPHTIHAHVRSIYNKLQINSRPEIQALFQQLNIDLPDPLPTLPSTR